ncbi:unnamed protein product [Fusarium graminearum]|nr:unnamed protein product [Fusarium graminearum]
MVKSTDGTSKRPNFLFILADDLICHRLHSYLSNGFSDIGCYGAEIETPNIDRLASEGIRMLNHHAAAACSPTRAMLLSGTDAQLGGLGVLIEYKGNEKGAKRYGGKAGYEGYLTENVATIPEILEDNGYYTAMSGKWHLGMRDAQGPWNRGFQKAFAMLPGCCNHYGWEPVQEKFPVGGRPIHAEGGKKVDMYDFTVVFIPDYTDVSASRTPNKKEDPNGLYSTDAYTDNLIQYFEERTEQDKEKPFFAYLPYTAPHWPLQCSKAQRDKYKGMYDDGPYALRERRLKKLVDLGIIDKSVIPHQVETETMGVGEWDDLSPEEKKLSSRAMEAYAGMVDSIDVNIGKVVDYLKPTGEYDNTFIVFMSDNGAEGAALFNSFTWLGPLWAQASTVPSRLFKCFPSQGGILVPCIVKPPTGTFHSSFKPGSFDRSFSTVMDFAPTFIDLAGVSLPSSSGKAPPAETGDGAAALAKTTVHFRGRSVHTIRGKSWVPFFSRAQKVEDNELWTIHSSTEPVGWELFARGALRKGNWKIVHISKQEGGAGVGDEGWELFNVVDDPGETHNLAESNPKKLQELLVHWDEYVVECGVVWGEKAEALGLDRESAPELWEDDTDLQRSWIGAKAGECLA